MVAGPRAGEVTQGLRAATSGMANERHRARRDGPRLSQADWLADYRLILFRTAIPVKAVAGLLTSAWTTGLAAVPDTMN